VRSLSWMMMQFLISKPTHQMMRMVRILITELDKQSDAEDDYGRLHLIPMSDERDIAPALVDSSDDESVDESSGIRIARGIIDRKQKETPILISNFTS